MGGERLLARKRGKEGIEIFVERWGRAWESLWKGF